MQRSCQEAGEEGQACRGPRLEAARLRSCRSPERLGPKKKGKRNYLRAGLMALGLNFLKASGPHRVLVNVRGGPETLVRAIKRRCPSRLGNRGREGIEIVIVCEGYRRPWSPRKIL